MNRTQLQPAAEIMVQSYMDAALNRRQLMDEYGSPPTIALAAQMFRYVAQVNFGNHERYALDTDYMEFGRLAFEDLATGRPYLVKSESAVTIEDGRRQNEALFNSAKYLRCDVTMLVHRFHKDGLDLAIAGTRQEAGKKRFVASGLPSYIGTWPYATANPPTPFDQGQVDPFSELGDLDEGEAGDAG